MNMQNVENQLHVFKQLIDEIAKESQNVETQNNIISKQQEQMMIEQRKLVADRAEVQRMADAQRGEMDKATKMMELARKIKQTADDEVTKLETKKQEIEKLESKYVEADKKLNMVIEKEKQLKSDRDILEKERKMLDSQRESLIEKQKIIEVRENKVRSDEQRLQKLAERL